MRHVEERHFPTHDGRELAYRHAPSIGANTLGAIVLFHRGHEHSGRMMHLADELGLPDFAVFAWDARGHGRSCCDGAADNDAHAMTRDVDSFIRHISETYAIAIEDIVVVGQSLGAVLLAVWVHDYAPRIRAMVLASPAFRIRLYVPGAWTGLKLLHRFRGDFPVSSYVKGRFLTHDAERAESYDTDPLVVRPISVRLLLGLDALARRVVADAAAIDVPTQVLISGADRVVASEPQHRFYERLGAFVKERVVLDGFYHDTLGEKDRARAIEHVREFVLSRFREPARRPSLLDADKHGATRMEADELARPLGPYSPRGLYWAAVRLGLRLGSLLSAGMRVGRDTGFDSGSSLDYVYRNEARGLSRIGGAVDRQYLDSIGWRGIRQRKTHVEQLLHDAAGRLSADGEPVRIVDIAAGHGRYVLDALEGIGASVDSVLLRDFSDVNVKAGKRLIEDRGLEDVADYLLADAFDSDGLAAIEPRPTLAIVSGLYELFPANDLVGRSLDGLFRALVDGGYLIYTGQPWHPQLELIGRALTSHRNGRPWIMRRRTQAELDQLVTAAGFTKIGQRVDEWGMFTVSLARKVAAVPSVSPGEFAHGAQRVVRSGAAGSRHVCGQS